MKQIITLLSILTTALSFSQVGIGTTTPNAQLDVVASSVVTPTNKDGILIPRINAFPTTNPTAAQNGMLVFYTVDNNFYYWDNATTSWLPFVRQIDDLRDGKSKNDLSVFLGVDAGAAFNTTNRNVIGIGYKSLESLSTGDNNLAFGVRALNSVTIAASNIAIGTSALQNNITGSQNIAIGTESQMNTNARNYNISIGFESMKNNTSGGENTSLGSNSLRDNVSGNFNVALGTSTLTANTTGSNNLAVGSKSLFNKITGDTNVAIGSNALLNMTGGNNNVSIGSNSMGNFDTGSNNTAIGHDAMRGPLAGGFSSASNVAIGYRAMSNNSTGSSNTVIGFNSFIRNQTGSSNVVIGNSANLACTTCTALTNITVVGTNANVQGNNSTAIGTNSLANGTNSTAIGYQASITGDNQIHLGNTSITAIRGQVAFSTYSDKRIKDNIKENVVGLDFIKKLRPVTYNLNVDKQNTIKGIVDTSSGKNKYESEKIRRTGFIAQEVEVAAKNVGYNFSGVSKPKNNKDLYGLTYAEFVVPLVKATQEQSLIIEKLLKKVETLTKRIEELEKNRK